MDLAWERSLRRIQRTGPEVCQHFLFSPTLNTQCQCLPLTLLISKKHFVQMCIWKLRANTKIENLKLRKELAFRKSTSTLLVGQCHAGCTEIFPFGLIHHPCSPQHFQETHGPAVMMGMGQSAVFSKLGSRMASGWAIIFMTTCKGDWKRFQVSINISSHSLNLFHCLYSTGSQYARGLHLAICCLAAKCHTEKGH